jgi:hypothetical protein
MFKKAILPLALILASGAASAGVVTNDTQLLSGDDHEQLAQWYGEDFDLTRIFAKGIDGDTSVDWHRYVDQKGPTFTVMEIFSGDERMVIGGYADFDWLGHTATTYGGVTNDSFLFNLTTGVDYQKNSNSSFLSVHRSYYGPHFGFSDLAVDKDLSAGLSKNIGYSFGDESQYNSDSYIEEFSGGDGSWTIGAFETYILSSSTGDFGEGATADVPAPYLLGSIGLLALLSARRKRAS